MPASPRPLLACSAIQLLDAQTAVHGDKIRCSNTRLARTVSLVVSALTLTVTTDPVLQAPQRRSLLASLHSTRTGISGIGLASLAYLLAVDVDRGGLRRGSHRWTRSPVRNWLKLAWSGMAQLARRRCGRGYRAKLLWIMCRRLLLALPSLSNASQRPIELEQRSFAAKENAGHFLSVVETEWWLRGRLSLSLGLILPIHRPTWQCTRVFRLQC